MAVGSSRRVGSGRRVGLCTFSFFFFFSFIDKKFRAQRSSAASGTALLSCHMQYIRLVRIDSSDL